nr:ATP synthase F0 subunit 8 [Paduniella sp. LP-2022]
MPQMYPMNWIILFIYFLMILKLTMSLYYFYNFKLNKYNHSNINNKFQMKW